MGTETGLLRREDIIHLESLQQASVRYNLEAVVRRASAAEGDSGSTRSEILRLMNKAYSHAGNARTASNKDESQKQLRRAATTFIEVIGKGRQGVDDDGEFPGFQNEAFYVDAHIGLGNIRALQRYYERARGNISEIVAKGTNSLNLNHAEAHAMYAAACINSVLVQRRRLSAQAEILEPFPELADYKGRPVQEYRNSLDEYVAAITQGRDETDCPKTPKIGGMFKVWKYSNEIPPKIFEKLWLQSGKLKSFEGDTRTYQIGNRVGGVAEPRESNDSGMSDAVYKKESLLTAVKHAKKAEEIGLPDKQLLHLYDQFATAVDELNLKESDANINREYRDDMIAALERAYEHVFRIAANQETGDITDQGVHEYRGHLITICGGLLTLYNDAVRDIGKRLEMTPLPDYAGGAYHNHLPSPPPLDGRVAAAEAQTGTQTWEGMNQGIRTLMAIAREELTGSPTVPELMEQDIIRKQAYGSLIGVYTQLTQKFGGSQRQRREAA